MPAETGQGRVQVKIRLFAPVEEAYGILPVIAADLHALHQRFNHAYFRLRNMPVGFTQIAQRAEQCFKKGFLGAFHAADTLQEAVYEMTHQCANNGARDATSHQAENSTD